MSNDFAPRIGEHLPAALEDFLNSQGWEQVSVSEGVASLWAPSDAEESLETRVVIPLNPENRDYAALLREAVVSASQALGTEPGRLRARLAGYGSDVVRLRSLVDTGPDGSVPLSAGRSLVEATQHLLVASAAATEHRRAYFGQSKTKRASQVGEQVRMGQTESGSYTITLVVRQPSLPNEDLAQVPLSHSPRYSFERRTLTTLATALAAADSAIKEYGRQRTVGAFLEGIADGISADFCEALLAMESVPESEGVAVSFDWAKTAPIQRDLPRQISFDRTASPALEAAVRKLRPSTEYENYRLAGRVTQLRRREGDQEGVATVQATVEGKPRSVLVPVAGQLHTQAIRAYDTQADIAVSGALISEGNRLYLVNGHTWSSET